jgi:hypothetical protein
MVMIESKRPTRSNLRSDNEGVSFYTPGVLKKPPLHRPASIFFHQLSHQLNYLARLLSAGITVAD